MGDLVIRKTWKTSNVITILALLAGVLAFANSPVEARTKYRTQFQKSYEKVAANHKINCFVCHKKMANGKIDKKHHNNYGEALEKALGAKNVKNGNKIKEAFGKIEKKKSAEKGKTFGELLEAGKLPGKSEEAEE